MFATTAITTTASWHATHLTHFAREGSFSSRAVPEAFVQPRLCSANLLHYFSLSVTFIVSISHSLLSVCGAFSLPFPHECFIYWRENDCSLQWGQHVGPSKTNCSRTSKWQSMITHCKESKWLPMEWIGGQRIMAEHRWKIDVWLGVITPLGGSLLIYHTNSKCFYSHEEVTGRNDCDWTEEEPPASPQSQHTPWSVY